MAMDNAARMMRDEILGKATGFVELGKRRWKLEYGFAQIAEFERLSGVSVLQVASMLVALKVDVVVKGLWVAMRQQRPKITEAKICTWLDREPEKLTVCVEEFIAAILRNLPLDEDTDEEEEGDGDTSVPLSDALPEDPGGTGTDC